MLFSNLILVLSLIHVAYSSAILSSTLFNIYFVVSICFSISLLIKSPQKYYTTYIV